MAEIIDGKVIANNIKSQIHKQVINLKLKGITPGLAVIIIGENQASKTYVSNKRRDCEEVEIYSKEYALGIKTTESELISLIKKLNHDSKINGILVQLPLPSHINEKYIIESIDPLKDVDAFNHKNVGKIMLNDYDLLPCTPAGIIKLLDSKNINLESKHCVVLGRSNIVGKPMAMLLLHRNATVTICHSKTKDLKSICKQADILIVAIGKSKFIKDDMIKKNAIVIDVGMNRENNKLCGDVDFENVKEKASFITPVPGGVGPMTRAVLLENTVLATLIQNKHQIKISKFI